MRKDGCQVQSFKLFNDIEMTIRHNLPLTSFATDVWPLEGPPLSPCTSPRSSTTICSPCIQVQPYSVSEQFDDWTASRGECVVCRISVLATMCAG